MPSGQISGIQTHIAFGDFRIVRDNLAGGHRVTTGRQVPFCMFTDPEFAVPRLTQEGVSSASLIWNHNIQLPLQANQRDDPLRKVVYEIN